MCVWGGGGGGGGGGDITATSAEYHSCTVRKYNIDNAGTNVALVPDITHSCDNVSFFQVHHVHTKYYEEACDLLRNECTYMYIYNLNFPNGYTTLLSDVGIIIISMYVLCMFRVDTQLS